MLKDKILEAAQAYIEKQEGVPATVEGWRVRRVCHHHGVVISVMVTTDQGYEAFEIWLVIDLDTEKIMTTA